MPRIIFKCPYIKPGTERAAAHLNNYVRYVATRDGTDLLKPDKASQPATKKQRAMVERLLRDFPMCRGMFEYEDYQSSPTRAAASEFITRALEDNVITGVPTQAQRSGLRGERRSSGMDEPSPLGGGEGYEACDDAAKRENYVSYIAQRPRAERIGVHGLFNGTGDALVLSRIAEEVANHPGNVWLPIISLRREDAARLGYDNARQWQALLSTYAPQIADTMNIPWEQFRWYASYHDEGAHPHVHMVCYSADGRSGFLDKEGIARIKSGLAKNIFRQELTEIYRQQTQRRDELVRQSGEVMKELIRQMLSGTLENPRIEQLMGELAQRLKSTSGRKQYGYLKAPLKAVVDEIVDELAKDTHVSSAYDLWYQLREEVLRTYRNDLPDRLPLSRQTEFKRIKNVVVEAARLGEHTEVFTPADTQEPPQAGENAGPEPEVESEGSDVPEEASEAPPAVVWSDRYKQARSFLYGDDETPQDHEQACRLFMEEALDGNALAMHDLGRMFVDGTGVEADTEQAHAWYAKALSAFQTVERQRPNRYVEYRIGWMLLHGVGTEQDESAALEWLEKSAELKNTYAEYQMAKHTLANPSAKRERTRQAVDWLTHAAEAGLDCAQYALGKLYRDGGPVAQDMTQAVIWFSQAAERGNQYAMYALGKLRLEADDPAAARRWFRQSADLGNQFAQYQLGKLLLCGDGVAKDTAGAVRWLTESAEQGNQYAQYALGKLYLLGKDISQDRESAVRWFTLAAEQGNEYARYFLDHMNDSPSLFASATRLLHHMGRIFQEQAPPPSGGISFVDSKLRRKIREKKIAMGHKPDDHEEPVQQLR
ncbi:hypothetical protein C814_02530 [Anaerotruncus sp. G3(2012)]|uniref:MobP3 family relaxase n=1 Tax=Anaerotruncus sp. G3(2012) TaxID=1235835 RepID=UPI0003354DF2|nr:MobP3 family relaxase [Anaerotruncus sp. G3(2012)]EOS57417.1 hypothetical protein C814_02530 [Anaerotruncus sp. G3(2012)]